MTEPLSVRANNDFHNGWLVYLLGEARPSDDIAADGWDMAADTPSVALVASVIGKMRELGQIIVEAK